MHASTRGMHASTRGMHACITRKIIKEGGTDTN
jgi:hypothetical protein